MKKENVIIAFTAMFLGAGIYAGIRELIDEVRKKRAQATEADPTEEEKTFKALVVNIETRDFSVVVLKKGEEVEDKTLAVIDTLHDFREYSVLQVLKAKRNSSKIKEAKLEIGQIADLWFRVKEQRDTITPEEITAMVREACDKKIEMGEQ